MNGKSFEKSFSLCWREEVGKIQFCSVLQILEEPNGGSEGSLDRQNGGSNFVSWSLLHRYPQSGIMRDKYPFSHKVGFVSS